MIGTAQMTRRPTTPGEILQTEFLDPMGLTQGDLAAHIGCDIKTINRLVKGRTRLTAELAVRLADAMKTTPEFWLNLQTAVDLVDARQTVDLPGPIARAHG